MPRRAERYPRKVAALIYLYELHLDPRRRNYDTAALALILGVHRRTVQRYVLDLEAVRGEMALIRLRENEGR